MAMKGLIIGVTIAVLFAALFSQKYEKPMDDESGGSFSNTDCGLVATKEGEICWSVDEKMFFVSHGTKAVPLWVGRIIRILDIEILTDEEG
jgi:hypothetical protein